MTKKKARANVQWRTIDLHLHTPASSDWQQPEVSYMNLLQRAEARGLEIIAFTDHNTVAGYRKMKEELQQLEMLQKLNRLMPEEQARLNEYRRLLSKVLVLPGFEFTATFGFHILGIFPPEKPVREIEYLLMSLNIPPDQLDDGSATVGATTDVLTAYRMINEAGGLVIAAHANSSNGVAMRGFNFGGQTKIAYTQDPNLHALEVTDLEQRGARTTAAFFNGTKPEYPRRMHCIQGSDAHRLVADGQRKRNPAVGERATDVLISEISFEALKELFTSNDFARTRPHRQQAEAAYDFIRIAREEGPNIVQSFHESTSVRGGKLYSVIADVCAFANTNGGTLFVGLSPDASKPVIGVNDAEQVVAQLEKEIADKITPPLQCTVDMHETGGKKILRVLVPRGDDPPYVVDDFKVYVRDEAETELAVRDEIVGLVLRGQRQQISQTIVQPEPVEKEAPLSHLPAVEVEEPPRTGVEVAAVVERDGGKFFTMLDLRNGNVVKNVTRTSARRLWHYAITEFSRLPADPLQAVSRWEGNLGLLKVRKQGQNTLYDLVQRLPQGLRYYYGVTEDGIHGHWKVLVGVEDE
ncbi:MAG: putative DNA binding domain-containing protein [Anaerolineales bacterium]|nr:putative DNA binding domain-containing protein [Anaerolineales bacterium]